MNVLCAVLFGIYLLCNQMLPAQKEGLLNKFFTCLAKQILTGSYI